MARSGEEPPLLDIVDRNINALAQNAKELGRNLAGLNWLLLARVGFYWFQLARIGFRWLQLARTGSSWPQPAQFVGS